jgi:hypothetical protein
VCQGVVLERSFNRARYWEGGVAGWRAVGRVWVRSSANKGEIVSDLIRTFRPKRFGNGSPPHANLGCDTLERTNGLLRRVGSRSCLGS